MYFIQLGFEDLMYRQNQNNHVTWSKLNSLRRKIFPTKKKKGKRWNQISLSTTSHQKTSFYIFRCSLSINFCFSLIFQKIKTNFCFLLNLNFIPEMISLSVPRTSRSLSPAMARSAPSSPMTRYGPGGLGKLFSRLFMKFFDWV